MSPCIHFFAIVAPLQCSGFAFAYGAERLLRQGFALRALPKALVALPEKPPYGGRFPVKLLGLWAKRPEMAFWRLWLAGKVFTLLCPI